MKVFITGVTGYIGGSIAVKLLEHGYRVSGLTRSQEKMAALEKSGITPVLGDIHDDACIVNAAGKADIVINAADADNAHVAALLISALKGTGKKLIQTSGSSIIGDKAGGEPSNITVSDESLSDPVAEKKARVAIDRSVIASSDEGVHSIVICPTMIYGKGLGMHQESIQVPLLERHATKTGAVRYIGRGLNRWSNVHIEDLQTLYLLAIQKAPSGSFFFAENGEEALIDIAGAIARKSGHPILSWSEKEAIEEWGFEPTVFALGSNSRARAVCARKLLDWQPLHNSLIKTI